MKKFLPKTSKGFTTFSLHKRGFTLVELLVVISIIAILSVIGLVIFSNVQKSARNAKRIADMKAIALALEAYYNDPVNKFKYPCSDAAGDDPETCSSVAWRGMCNGPNWRDTSLLVPGLVPTYLAEFPSDPQTSNCVGYGYRSNGIDYKLMDLAVAEITIADLQAHLNLWDPRSRPHPPVPLDGPCGGYFDSPRRTFAIYSQNSGTGPGYAQCW